MLDSYRQVCDNSVCLSSANLAISDCGIAIAHKDTRNVFEDLVENYTIFDTLIVLLALHMTSLVSKRHL